MKTTIAALLAAALLAVGSAPEAAAQDAAPAPRRARVLLLGTFHMSGGADYLKSAVPDVTTPERQREIEALVEKLRAFRPTKVAVEVPYGSTRVQEEYAAYLRGERAPQRDETEQVGFRLARAMGHARVHPIDHRKDMDVGAVFRFAGEHQPALAAELQGLLGRIMARDDSVMKLPVLDIYRAYNDPASADFNRRMYLRLAEVGRDSSYVGADELAGWYDRNLRIFANLLRTVESPEERVLVIMGQSHTSLLRSFVVDHPALELVEAYDYLR